MSPKNLLIFGATGTIGSFILEAILAARSQFDRVAIFTSPRTAETKAAYLEKLKAQNIEVIVGDVEDENAVKAAYNGTYTYTSNPSYPRLFYTFKPVPNPNTTNTKTGIDTVISALGRMALAQQIPLIRLAAASPSVKLFLPSEYGTDIAYGPASANEKPHQQKLKVRALLEKEIPREQLDYAYVVTGPFAEMYLHITPGVDEAGGWDVKARKAVLLGEKGEARVSLTTMKE